MSEPIVDQVKTLNRGEIQAVHFGGKFVDLHGPGIYAVVKFSSPIEGWKDADFARYQELMDAGLLQPEPGREVELV